MIITEENFEILTNILNNEIYDLWMGTGVSLALNNTIPNWNQLKEGIWEKLKEVKENLALDFLVNTESKDSTTLPEKIENYTNHLNKLYLSNKLRELTIDPFYKYNFNEVSLGTFDETTMLAIYNLGKNVKNIINFNYECITSFICAIGSYKNINIQQYDTFKSRKNLFNKITPKEFDQYINIFHPHGCLDIYGNLVLTKTDYINYFSSKYSKIPLTETKSKYLIILGLGLGEDDEYLKEYLKSMTKEKTIFWLKPDATDKQLDIAIEIGINIIDINYQKFWGNISTLKITSNKEEHITPIKESLINLIKLLEKFHKREKILRSANPLTNFFEARTDSFYCYDNETQMNLILSGRRQNSENNLFLKNILETIDSDREKYFNNKGLNKQILLENYKDRSSFRFFKLLIDSIEIFL